MNLNALLDPAVTAQLTSALLAILDALVVFGVIHVDASQKPALVTALTAIVALIQTVLGVSAHRVQVAQIRAGDAPGRLASRKP